jgi:hypothetical protein
VADVPANAAAASRAPGEPKLLDRIRATIRRLHYSPRTELAYVNWIKRFIFYHGIRHPAELGADEVRAFLSHIAVRRHVSSSTCKEGVLRIVSAWTAPGLRSRGP